MTKKAYITVKDEVYAQISGLEPHDQKVLSDKMAVMVEGAFFMPAYKLGHWDGKIRFFDNTGKIYFRLLDEVTPYLDAWGYDIELKDERTPIELPDIVITDDWFTSCPITSWA